MPIFRGEIQGLHPSFSEESEARVVMDAEVSFGIDEPKVVYTEDDDVAIEKFVRRNGESSEELEHRVNSSTDHTNFRWTASGYDLAFGTSILRFRTGLY